MPYTGAPPGRLGQGETVGQGTWLDSPLPVLTILCKSNEICFKPEGLRQLRAGGNGEGGH